MDSITQAALGAAVGEAVLGRKVGGKAAAWGAFLGTLPDLDILAYPFLDPAQELLFHRGPTHALLFSVAFAPLVGLLLDRVHPKDRVGWKGWAWLAFLALFTHPILDSFTAYGTQLLLPFTNRPIAFNTISIIDPIYSVPLVVGLIASLLCRRSTKRRWMYNTAGLVLSSAYLSFTVPNKLYVSSLFESELERQAIEHTQVEVMPSLFNNVLWIGLAANDSTVFAGLYSLLDSDNEIPFQEIPKNQDLLPSRDDNSVLAVLHWFSRGLFAVSSDNGEIFYNDLHVGRTDFFMSDQGQSIFSFQLEVDEDDLVVGFETRQPDLANRSELLRALARRVRGEERILQTHIDALQAVRTAVAKPVDARINR